MDNSTRLRRSFEVKKTPPSSHEIAAVLAKLPTAGDNLFIIWLLRREEEREASGLNALMDKFEKARAEGLDLNEADKTRLLALLLDDRLRGTGGYGS